MQIPVVGYEGLYEVTDTGEVWSIRSKKFMTLSTGKDGVVRVSLSCNGKDRAYTVHRLVATAFIHNPENKPQIDHIDGNKQNNRVTNLRWCTNAENQAYREGQGNSGNKEKAKIVTWGVLTFPSIHAAAKYIASIRGSKEETVRKELKAARYGERKLYGELVSIS